MFCVLKHHFHSPLYLSKEPPHLRPIKKCVETQGHLFLGGLNSKVILVPPPILKTRYTLEDWGTSYTLY